MVHAREILPDGNVVDTYGDVRIAADFRDAKGWREVPEIEWPDRSRPTVARAYDYDEGETALRDLGGLERHELTPAQELAQYNAGLGNDELRKRVEKRLKAEEQEKQRAVAKAGAELVRRTTTTADTRAGGDSSTDLAMRRLNEHKRTRRA